MPNLPPNTLLETPSGSGDLRVAGAHLAKVFYHLQIRRASVNGELAWEITGAATVSQDEPMQAQVLRRVGSGELLTLHLADGRWLEVYATQEGAYAESFRLTPGNPIGFRLGSPT